MLGGPCPTEVVGQQPPKCKPCLFALLAKRMWLLLCREGVLHRAPVPSNMAAPPNVLAKRTFNQAFLYHIQSPFIGDFEVVFTPEAAQGRVALRVSPTDGANFFYQILRLFSVTILHLKNPPQKSLFLCLRSSLQLQSHRFCSIPLATITEGIRHEECLYLRGARCSVQIRTNSTFTVGWRLCFFVQ